MIKNGVQRGWGVGVFRNMTGGGGKEYHISLSRGGVTLSKVGVF